MTTPRERDLIAAVRSAFEEGATVQRRVNSRPGWSKTAQQGLERKTRKILRTVLDREPTGDEVDAAMAADDWQPALDRLGKGAS